MKKVFLILYSLFFAFLLSPAAVFADSCGQLSGPGCVCAAGTTDTPSLACFAPIVVNIVNVAFIFLGVVAVIFLLFGSIRFIVSRGDQKAVTAAKNTITYAIIGMILVVLAFVAITIFTNFLGFPNILQNFTLYQQ